jgi:hypothetical protein
MFEWLGSLFSKCQHHWTIIKTVKIFESAGDKLPIGVQIILRCDKCGDIKTKRIA